MSFLSVFSCPSAALLVLLICATSSTAARAEPGAASDPQLQALLAEAVRNSPEIRAASNEREAAQQRVSPAGALDDPMLDVGVRDFPVESRRFDADNFTMKMIGLSQKIPYPGKRRLRKDVAAQDADSVAHAYQETVNRVVRDVKMAYFDLAFVAESARLVEKNKRVLEQFLKISESRYAVGQGNQADVLKAQTQLSRLVDELIRLARDREAIEAELVRALGRESDVALPAPAPLRLPETALPYESLRETALKERPQLLALQSIIARNGKALELARKDYFPDFDVSVSYGQRDTLAGGIEQEDFVNLSVAINLPIWRQSKRDPQVAAAIAMRNQATDLYQAQLNEVSSQLRRQVANAQQSLKSARLYETGILPQARLTVESSLAAYRVDRVDFLTLLDNQMTVFDYEVSHAAALSNYNKALAEIGLLTGRTL
jgi:cobalt-zinc-cadmium efflux system outer membrane protein